jgi:hypothetical protein
VGLGRFEEDWGRIGGTGFKKCLITNTFEGTDNSNLDCPDLKRFVEECIDLSVRIGCTNEGME